MEEQRMAADDNTVAHLVGGAVLLGRLWPGRAA
jgi:hypothetical protein